MLTFRRRHSRPAEPKALSQFEQFLVSRRGFARVVAGAVLAFMALPTSWAQAKKLAVPLANAEPLKKVGGSTVLKIKDQEVLFVRDGEQSVKAVNPNCTHKKCKVYWKEETGFIHCKCHKSKFGLDGAVLGGPAPTPLQTFPATLEGDRIVLTLPDAPA